MDTTSLIQDICRRGRISAEDVVALRSDVFGDGVVERGEADRLFQLNDACAESDASWKAFFTEALVDFLINRVPPQGYVDDADATFLIERITRDGVVKSETDLELLLKVMEAARECPPPLIACALEQVAHAVLTGQTPGQLGASELRLLSRILYAGGGQGGLAVTRAEAERLFDIKDAAKAGYDPSWPDFFAKAIGNSLMAAFGDQRLSRAEALRLDRWVHAPKRGPGAFIKDMLTSRPIGLGAAKRAERNDEAERAARRDTAEREARQVTDDEAQWLIDRIGRDNDFDACERALIKFIHANSSAISPALKSFIDKVADRAA